MIRIRTALTTTIAITVVCFLSACTSGSGKIRHDPVPPGCSTAGGKTDGTDRMSESPVQDKPEAVREAEEIQASTAPAPSLDRKLVSTKPRSRSPMAALAKRKAFSGMATSFCPPPHPGYPPRPEHTTEQYDRLYDNEFLRVSDKPLSTFSIDVDAASYANVRRFLDDDRLPPRDAVRIEELINYFTYDYPEPTGDDPFSITTEMAGCPWHPDHHLVHIGLQGRRIDTESLPPSNLVFLLDVSGSMHSPDKLPLLKSAMTMLVNNLRPVDNVAIVVYAGAAGLVLPTTPGDRRGRILGAIERLSAGGSTAGGAGIRLAYATARDQFIDGGNNRVILATDGDFNVGVSSEGELVRMIEEEREHGVFLTVLGFGTGNYKDATMEKLADKGNGNYAYIDNVLEARKVLVSEMGGTLVTIAKDVKIQVEFNPATVGEYRLIGYVNRRLEDRDFNDDTKDAGELGAGHTVTALYEVVPVGVETAVTGKVDALKYQTSSVRRDAAVSGEVLTVKFRYKKPDGNSSMLITRTLRNRLERRPSTAFRFSAAVAGFGMLLRESRHAGKLGWRQVYEMARESRGEDRNGYRAELMRLTEKAAILAAGRRAGASAYPVGE